MKKTITLILSVLTCLLMQISLMGQITIDASDIADFYGAGKARKVYSDSLDRTYDIGILGGGNMWDFTSAIASDTIDESGVNPSDTPHFSDFPNANIALLNNLTVDDVNGELYTYFNLTDEGFNTLGSSGTFSSGPLGLTVMTTFSPQELLLDLPATFGDSWEYQGAINSLSVLSGFPAQQTVSYVQRTSTVDAYGTLMLPNGVVEEALRIKEVLVDSTEVAPGFPEVTTSVSFIFITKSGTLATFSSIDTLQDVGVVEGSIVWTLGDGVSSTTSLEKIGISLDSPFPNPFQEETMIYYHLESSERINLSVWNTLGNKVVDLFDGQQLAGEHNISFEAENLPSGIYFITLQGAKGVITKPIKLEK